MPRTFIAMRSVLYVPGSNTRALEKTKTLSADAFIFDLEDAVSPEVKNDARKNVLKALDQNDYGKKQTILRVNSLSSHWGYDDLVAAAKSNATAVLLPKIESADMIRQAETVLSNADAPDDLAIWCMMETPRSMLHAEEIASASSKIRAVVIGTSDLAKDLGALHTRERLPFLTSLCLCIMAARAADVAIIDGVHLDLKDDEGFNYACQQGRELGFDGKTLIHPKTISKANEIFSPSLDEIAWSNKIILAYKEAAARGEGVVVVDGKLIESLHIEGARRTLLLANAIAKLPVQ